MKLMRERYKLVQYLISIKQTGHSNEAFLKLNNLDHFLNFESSCFVTISFYFTVRQKHLNVN